MPFILMNDYIGFTLEYLRQYWFRVCRCGVSALAEASTILQTFPKVVVGTPGQKKSIAGRWGTDNASQAQMTEKSLEHHLINAQFSYLRLKNLELDFDVQDPVPADDPEYGPANTGSFTIFEAVRDDPGFKLHRKMYNVVADGNQVTSRRLMEDEKDLAKKALAGRPRKIFKKPATAILKKPAATVSADRRGKRKLTGRCKVVRIKDKEQRKERSHTGGLKCHWKELVAGVRKRHKHFEYIDFLLIQSPKKAIKRCWLRRPVSTRVF